MMKRMFPLVVAVAIVLGAVVPVMVGAGTASACQGLTPGYWKNHLNAWPEGFAPGDSFDGAFGLDNENPGLTLEGALRTGGGKFDALNRHAAAALLNSYEFPYPGFYTPEDVIEMVQDAYESGDWQSAKDTLEYANEYGE